MNNLNFTKISLSKNSAIVKVLASIEKLPNQLSDSFKQFNLVKLPRDYNKINKIIVCGMGGSALGADLVRNLFNDYLKVPIIINNQYHLPRFADQNSLIILTSYSGNTEETLSCLKEARKKQLKTFVITSGGQLANIAKKKKLPCFIFNPINNPSAQPRLGAGYSIGILWQLLKKLNLLKIKTKSEEEFIRALKIGNERYNIKKNNNLAKNFALKLYQKLPIIVASEFLNGNAHLIANQINESAKIFANYFILPELNHHLLEGLIYPKDLRKHYQFIFITSNLYHLRNQKRYQLTKEILRRQKISFLEFKPTGRNIFQQSAEALVFGSYLSFYLAGLYQVNPIKTPWIDFIKKSLKD